MSTIFHYQAVKQWIKKHVENGWKIVQISLVEDHFKWKLNMMIWCGSLFKFLIRSYSCWKRSCWKVLLLGYMEKKLITEIRAVTQKTKHVTQTHWWYFNKENIGIYTFNMLDLMGSFFFETVKCVHLFMQFFKCLSLSNFLHCDWVLTIILYSM